MKHIMNLQDAPFLAIKNGTKTIEMRLYDEKRKKINIGDIIEFNNDNTEELLETKVIGLHKFKKFEDLYNSFDKISIGYKLNDKANPKDMSQYYDADDIKKNGVIGIEIKLI